MRLRVLAVGRLKAGPERDLAERYRGRAAGLARTLGFAGPEIVELVESRARREADRQIDEAARLRERGDGLLVLLDEAAPSPSSESFAARLVSLRDGGQPAVTFVVGGPDGLDPALKREGGWSLSFGRLTLPHGLARVLLLEQLYRAFTIIGGHPYHRAGGGEA